MPVLLAGSVLLLVLALGAAGSQTVCELSSNEALYAAYCAEAESYLRLIRDDRSDGGRGYCWGVPILETRTAVWGTEEEEIMAPLLSYQLMDVGGGTVRLATDDPHFSVVLPKRHFAGGRMDRREP